jgi:hypothetical protein
MNNTEKEKTDKKGIEKKDITAKEECFVYDFNYGLPCKMHTVKILV